MFLQHVFTATDCPVLSSILLYKTPVPSTVWLKAVEIEKIRESRFFFFNEIT